MPSNLEHRLVQGFIHNWLAAGPRRQPITPVKAASKPEENRLLRIYKSVLKDQRAELIDFSGSPMEMEAVGGGRDGLEWRYFRCLDDHLVDLSEVQPIWTYLSAWAYTVLKVPAAQKAVLNMTTAGPLDLWLNGTHVFREESFQPFPSGCTAVEVDLLEGENRLFVRTETVGVEGIPFGFALQVSGLSAETSQNTVVLVPTGARYPRRHEIVEDTFEKAYLEEVVNHRGAHFNLRWADDKGYSMKFAYQVQDEQGAAYVDGYWESDQEKPLDVGHTYRLNERAYYVVLRPILLEFFEHNLRYEKKFPIHVLDNAYSSTPAGTFSERSREAMEDAARRDGSLSGMIARMALGRWDEVSSELILAQIQKVNRREAGSEVILLGLLGMVSRYGKDSHFSENLAQAVEDCALNFRYWPDEGPVSSRFSDGLGFEGETARIQFHACEVLAGQLYPRQTFANSGKKGLWQRKQGERMAVEWLRQKGAFGWQDWNSNNGFEKNVFALSHLTSLAEDVTLRELAAVMLDKTFFSLAVHSYQGAFGATHGRTSAKMLKSAQLEATAGISRMLWGTGVFNGHYLATLSLAQSTYEFPLLLADIANDQTRQVWVRERHVVDAQAGSEVNTVTYKTPDFMLSSAQDYRPGEPGAAEHIWQATLGSDAVVFVNHPACMSDSDAHQPGFWLGNRSLPRVGQWKDVLVAVHHLPDGDWMGYTHAYFPQYMFQEHEIRADSVSGRTWAFARKDNGYLAITASNGLVLEKHAPDGYRELRSYGQDTVWLCHMGRAETDGSFENFKKHILAMKLDVGGLDLRCKTLRGEYLSFGWKAPLMVNGKEQSTHGYKHHESLYGSADLPAAQMDIQVNGMGMRLDFS